MPVRVLPKVESVIYHPGKSKAFWAIGISAAVFSLFLYTFNTRILQKGWWNASSPREKYRYGVF